MSAASPNTDEYNASWWSVFRPGALAVCILMVSLAYAKSWPPSSQFILLRCVDLLVLSMYVSQFSKSDPSLLEVVGIALIGAGFLYLVFKAVLGAALLILILILGWVVMTWIAKKWPMQRGVAILSIVGVLVHTAVLIMLVNETSGLAGIIKSAAGQTLLCLLTFASLSSSHTWRVEKMKIPIAQARTGLFWTVVLTLSVFGECITPSHSDYLIYHHYGGILVATITVYVALRVRVLFAPAKCLRMIPPALVFLPISQVVLGLFVTSLNRSYLVGQFHRFNGLCILVFSAMMLISLLSRIFGFQPSDR